MTMAQAKKMIYIADDALNIRELIRSFLLNAGYDVMAFSNGDDYLVKPFSPIELVTRINALFRRMAYDRSKTEDVTDEISFGNMVIRQKTREITYNGERFEVSPTEYAFLVYLFSNQDRAVSRDELLQHVWQFESQVDTRATDDVVKRLRKKLSHTNIRIEAVWGFGFKMEIAHE